MRVSLRRNRRESNRRNAIHTTFAVFFTCFIMLTAFIFPAGRIEAASSPKDLDPPVETVIQTVGNRMQKTVPSPDFSSVWGVIDLYRSGLTVPSSYGDTFYNSTVMYLQEKKWSLTSTKYTEYAKLILGMTAVGKDARDISGHDLLAYLSDFSKVKLQGFNGPVWALIALKCHPEYEIPVDANVSEQTTEEGLINYILNHQTPRGGWTLVGNTPDVDITGMTIQALAPYYGKRDDVTQAVDKAVERLYLMQLETGGFSTMDVETSESCAQVIVALSSIGIDCGQDERFNCNGNWPMSRLFDFYLPEGGFMHVMAGADSNGGGEAGTLDGMATEQGMYAAIAYQRMLKGQTALYDMSDIDISPGESVEPSKPDATTQKQEDTTKSPSGTTQSEKTKKIKVKAVYLDYRQISLQKGKSRTLKATISPSNAINKKVKWTSSNKKVATVTQKGKVKGIKAGNATITATARDGSKKKATCKVIVYSLNSGNKTSSSGNGGSNSATRYSNQTGGSQGNTSGNSYYPAGNSGQTSGQTSSSGSTETINDTSTTTEAGAWTFDGETYQADSGDTSGETDAALEEEDYDEEMSEDDESGEDLLDESEDRDSEGTSHLPAWLSICFGILSSGGLAGSFRLPWRVLRKRLLMLLAYRGKS